MSNEVSPHQGVMAKALKAMATIKQAEQTIEQLFADLPIQDRQEFERAVESIFKK